MKNRSSLSLFPLFLLVIPLVFFTGCGKKKVTDHKKMSHTVGKGLPLSGSKGSKKYGKEIEAFVLDDEESSTPTTLALNSKAEHAWVEDRASSKGFEPVLFDFDKFNIREDQGAVVAYDTAKAKSAVAEGKLLKVEGHADKHYVSEIYNLAISQKRAHTLVNTLAEAGIDKSALKPVGFGATRPAVDLPGKVQENRRAEIVPLTA